MTVSHINSDLTPTLILTIETQEYSCYLVHQHNLYIHLIHLPIVMLVRSGFMFVPSRTLDK